MLFSHCEKWLAITSSFHASSLVYSRFYLYRYLCLHQRSSSPPHEWKIRNGQDSDPLQAVDRRKTRFSNKYVHFGGIGKRYTWLMGVEKRVLRHRFNKKWAVLSGRRAAAAPHERSPEKELQVQPVGPCASGEKEHLSLSNFDRFNTCHIQGVSAPSYAYRILFGINTFLFFSDTSFSENVQSLRPVLVPL